MKQVLFAVLLIAVACGSVSGSVIDATDATFDEIIKGDLVMMEFYAPWCGHCKKLEPEFAKAASELAGVGVLAKLDATVEKGAAAKFEIKGFPTIKIFRNGELSGDYEGGRTAADIVKFMKNNAGPAVRSAVTAEDLAKLKSENQVLAVIQSTGLGGELMNAFETVAKNLRQTYAFAAVSDASLFDGEDNSVIVYTHFDEKREVFAGQSDVQSITAFVAAAGTPLFDEIGPTNYKMYIERKLPIVWIFATPADTVALDAGKGAAPSFKGKLSFVWIDSSKYAGMAQRLGLKGDKFPAVAIDFEGKHFTLEQDVTTDALTTFAQAYVDGTLSPTVKSETAPEPHTVDGLTTVVGSTFTALVEEADTDVFIEFYAPWCGHCKQLAPIYAEVAKQMKDAPVRIAHIDATANDFNQAKFNVQGFPTIFFVPKSTRVPTPYEGGRSEEALLKFLKEKVGGN